MNNFQQIGDLNKKSYKSLRFFGTIYRSKSNDLREEFDQLYFYFETVF